MSANPSLKRCPWGDSDDLYRRYHDQERGVPLYDPDKLFGRHLALLGTTGAGKSCSVAGLIRLSLDAAADAR